MKRLLAMLLLICLPLSTHDVADKNIIIVCNLSGLGTESLGQDPYINVEIEQTIGFNEDEVYTIDNKFLSNNNFFQPEILKYGIESGWMNYSSKVTPNYINIDFQKSYELQKFLNVDVESAFMNISINRLSGISKTTATYWYKLNILHDETFTQYRSEYSATGLCSKGINKF